MNVLWGTTTTINNTGINFTIPIISKDLDCSGLFGNGNSNNDRVLKNPLNFKQLIYPLLFFDRAQNMIDHMVNTLKLFPKSRDF